jgi:ribosomal protein L29
MTNPTPSKKAIEMSPEERKSALDEIRRGPSPEPMPTDLMARDMTSEQRAKFLAEVKRRFT